MGATPLKTPNTSSPHVFSPSSLQQLLSLKREMPNALVFAGGTYILRRNIEERYDLSSDIIFLGTIEDFTRVSRTERYLEIGSMVTIHRVLSIGKHILPECLYTALREIGSPAIRNMATIGGNLCVKERRMTAFPVLLMLDTRLELRKSGGSRWVQMNRLVNSDGSLDFKPGEILTRLRIPNTSWNFQFYRSLRSGILLGRNDLSICALGQVQKGVLSDFRFAFGSIGPFLYRNREVESQIIGMKLPFSKRDTDTFRGLLEQSSVRFGSDITSFQKKRILDLFSGALTALQHSVLSDEILLE
jgi:CO/xanthine dehydrogenase FAD-binding subunit